MHVEQEDGIHYEEEIYPAIYESAHGVLLFMIKEGQGIYLVGKDIDIVEITDMSKWFLYHGTVKISNERLSK